MCALDGLTDIYAKNMHAPDGFTNTYDEQYIVASPDIFFISVHSVGCM